MPLILIVPPFTGLTFTVSAWLTQAMASVPAVHRTPVCSNIIKTKKAHGWKIALCMLRLIFCSSHGCVS